MRRLVPDLAFMVGVIGATILFGLLMVPFDSWAWFFAHPTQFDRFDALPANTTLGITLFRMTLLFGAIAWLVAPMVLGRIEATTALRPTRLRFREGLIVAGLLAVGAALRWLRLDESLWYDEITALLSFSIHGAGPSLGNYFALSNHALHSTMVALSISTAGAVNEDIVRTPAFLFGLASIPAMYVLARSIGGRRVGLLSAALLAMMPVAILESTEARGYSMMLFFAIVSSTLALSMRHRGANLQVLAYAVCVTLGIWTHLVFICIPIGHAIVGLFWFRGHATRRAAQRLGVGLLLGAVSTVIVLAPLLPDLFQLRGEFQASDGNEPTLFGIEGAHALLQLGGSWTWWASIPGGVLAIIGTVSMCRRRQGRVSIAMLALGGVVAVVSVGLADSWLYARFVVFMLAAASVAMAMGLRSMRPRTAMIVASVVCGVWTVGLALRGPKQPISQGVEAAAARATDGRVLSIGLVDDVAAYYARPFEVQLQSTGVLGETLGDLATTPDVAVMLYPNLVSEHVVEQLHDAGYREIARFSGWLDWGNGDVVVLGR